MRCIDEIMDAEIVDMLEMRNKLDLGSDEHSKACDDIAKLYKLRIEEDRYLDGERKNRMLSCAKIGVETFGIIAPLMFYGIWMKRGFRFEESGTYTSRTFTGLTKWFKPTK